MIRHLVVFIYIFGIFFGMTGMFLHWLMSKKKDLKKEEQNIQLRNFMIITFLIGLISFFTFYSQYIIFYSPANTAIRLLDYLFWACFIIYWIDYLDSMVYNRLLYKFKIYLKYWCLCYIVIWLFATSYIWDKNYYIISRSGEVLFILLDILFCLLSVSVVAIYTFHGQTKVENRASAIYILTVSAALTIYTAWEFYHYLQLFTGNAGKMTSVLHPFNATAFFLLFINLITLIYVYRNEFSNAYLKDTQEAKMEIESAAEMQSSESVIDPEAFAESIATKHNLTPREKEIMEFVFKGFNNAEIAEELFISQNTVKHHIYNLFKKLNVSNRVELLCLLQEHYS